MAKSSLKTLVRVQKFNIDEQRKLLNEQLEVEDKILLGIKALEDELAKEKAFAEEHPEIGDFGAYFKRYQKQREGLETALQMVRRKIDEIQDKIAEMFKEQKTFEIVDKNREQQAIQEEEHKMQQTLDEIGTNNYIKQQKQ